VALTGILGLAGSQPGELQPAGGFVSETTPSGILWQARLESRRQLPATSTERVIVTVTATEVDGSDLDLADLALAFAFPGLGVESSVWYDGDWLEVDTLTYASVLVGPGADVDLDAGDYTCWVRVVDEDEAPTLNLGRFEIV
jgi:hypothetical protein